MNLNEPSGRSIEEKCDGKGKKGLKETWVKLRKNRRGESVCVHPDGSSNAEKKKYRKGKE